MKKSLLFIAITSAFMFEGAYAYSNADRLLVNGLSNATPGTTVLAVDWDTNKYYTWSKDNQMTEVPVLDVDGKKVVSVNVDRQISNARMDFWGGYDWGVAEELRLNFSQDLSLNDNTTLLNSYGAVYANDGDFDLTLNFEKGKNFIAYAKSAEYGEGGIVNGDYHSGNVNINGGTLSIYTVKQDKSDCKDTLHALYNEGTGAININNESVLIQQKDSDASRIYGITNLASGGINIYTKSLTIETVPSGTNQNNMYSAIYSQGRGVSPISINSEIVSIHDADYPVCANGGSIVINSTEAYINSAYGTHDDVAINQWSVYSMNGGSVIFNETGNHRLNTAGYMNADGGSIALRAGADSIMQHRAVIEGNGTFNMTLLDRAVWHMPHNNTLTNLAFEDGGSVDFDHDYNFTQDTPNFKNLTTTTLSGKGGTLGMRIDMAKDADTVLANDQIIVSGAATGEHKVAIDFVNGLSSIPEGKTHSANWLISQGEGSNLTLTNKDGGNTFSGRGMVTVWSLGFVGENEKDKLDTDEGRAEVAENTTGSGQGNWYLIKHDVASPNPDPDPENPNPAPDPEPELPPEVADNLLLGTSAAQAMSFSKDDKTLRHRMGEVRYGTQDGSWVRVDAQKDRFETGFKQKTYGLMVGYDSLTERKKGSVWLLGGAFRYANSDQEALATRQVDGELEQYSVKMYGTWIHDKGSYADIVLQAGRFDQEVNGLDNVGTGTAKADYTTYGFGASVEVGHTFKFSQNAQTNDHWFVEPQFQLSYFYAKGKDYTTSTGLRVEQGNADFLTGRAGAVFGKKFNLGSITDPRYFQLAFTGGLNHEFMGDQNIRYIGVDGASQTLKAHGIDGTRLYYGLTADWQCTDMLRAYAYFEREEGDGYTQDYDINIGLKYLF